MPLLCTSGDNYDASLGFCQFLPLWLLQFPLVAFKDFLQLSVRYIFYNFLFLWMFLSFYCGLEKCSLFANILIWLYTWKYVCLCSSVGIQEKISCLWSALSFKSLLGCAGSGLCFYARILKINGDCPFLLIMSGRQKSSGPLSEHNLFHECFCSLLDNYMIFYVFIRQQEKPVWSLTVDPIHFCSRKWIYSDTIISIMFLLIMDIFYYVIVTSWMLPAKNKARCGRSR